MWQSYNFWAGFLGYHNVNTLRRSALFSVSSSALICGTLVMGAVPDARASEIGEKSHQKVSRCHDAQRIDSKIAQTCLKDTSSKSLGASASVNNGETSAVDGGTENLRVYGTSHSYTAPAVEAWGKTPVALKDIPH